MKKVAVLIDAGFLKMVVKRTLTRHIKPEEVVVLAKNLIAPAKEELFRIFYYDAPPYNKTLRNPIDGIETDYSASALYKAVVSFHVELAEKQYVALRRGKLSFGGWRLTKNALEKIKTGKYDKVSPKDLEPDFKQKAVDMNIGLDIAMLSTKRIVDKVVLVTADNDFVPAMKFARKEGLHVAVVKFNDLELTSDMKQHSDQIIEINLPKILEASV